MFANDRNSGFVRAPRLQNTRHIHQGGDDLASPCLTYKLPPNRSDDTSVPSTLSTSFWLRVRLKAASHPTPGSFITWRITWHQQLLLSTLFASLHKRFIISSEIEIGTVIQLFTVSASRVDLRLYAASACRALSANTAHSTQRGSDQVVNSALEQIGNCSFGSPSSPPQLFSPCFFPPSNLLHS